MLHMTSVQGANFWVRVRGSGVHAVLALAGAGLLARCDCAVSDDAAAFASVGQAVRLDGQQQVEPRTSEGAEPAADYTLFEVGPVRPVAVLGSSGLVAVTNTVDDYLELLKPVEPSGLERCGAVKVGMRPVAV